MDIMENKILSKEYSENEKYIKEYLFKISEYLNKSPYILKNIDFKSSIPLVSANEGGMDTYIDQVIAMDIKPIISTYLEILKKFYCAKSAHEIYEKLDNDYKLCWKYGVRNFYMRNIISDLFSIADYIAFFINKLSIDTFEANFREVSFSNMKKKINDCSIKSIGYLNEEDIKILKEVFKELGQTFNKPNSKIRNISIHRHYLSIDEYPITGYLENGVRRFSNEDNPGQFTYEEIYRISEDLIKAIFNAIRDILEISSIKRIIKK